MYVLRPILSHLPGLSEPVWYQRKRCMLVNDKRDLPLLAGFETVEKVLLGPG